MKKYKVVRSYHHGDTSEKKLQEALDKGWIIEFMSNYAHQESCNDKYYFGYIEYILSKEVKKDGDLL